MPKILKEGDALELEHGGRCIVEVRGAQVHIVDTGEGVVVDIWPCDEQGSADEPVASTWAAFNELRLPEED